MAEKRMLSKVISISEKVHNLEDIFHMLLFTWIIPHTDDWGRLVGSPKKVKSLVIPMMDKTTADVEKALIDLHNNGLISWYEVHGEKFIQVINFEEHQSGLHKRTKSKIPEPFPEIPGTSRNFSEIPLEQNRTEQKRTRRELEEKGTEGSDYAVSNPHSNKINSWLNEFNVKCKGIAQLEDIESFVGAVDIEVIEAAIKQSEGKSVPYAVQILTRWISEGKTTKDSLKRTLTSRNILTPQRGSRPQLAIVSAPKEDNPLSQEELDELKRLALKLDGKEVTA